jgi:hypothetical protein
MVKNIGPRFPRLPAALEAELGADRSVFMCMHKEAKHFAFNYETHFARFEVGHWGAVDGRTGHHSIALSRSDLGEQYFLCITGAQNDEWLRSPDWKQHSNVRKVMEQRQLSVSISSH